jgi:hypothetical protein
VGKVFITDEVNDNYTADVTNAGKLKVETGAARCAQISSAHTITSAERISSTPCYLKSVLIGRYPATAAQLVLFNGASAGLEGYSAYGTSGDNIIAKFTYNVGAGSAAVCAQTTYEPRSFLIDAYCSSGLIAAISPSANCADGYIGCMEDVTIVYQS